MSRIRRIANDRSHPGARLSTARHRGDWQGMNWIRQDKRLAIYLRDGLACAWCARGVEEPGVTLTLDHVRPHALGGSNEARNLVTACKRCNDSRGKRSVELFAQAVAAYVGSRRVAQRAGVMVARIRAQAKRDLAPFREQARAMIASRGSVAAALAAGRSL